MSSDLFSKKKSGSSKSGRSTNADPNSGSLFGGNLTTRNTSDDQDDGKQKITTLFGATIPWDMSLRYNVGYSNRRRENEISSNSLQFSGNIELSPKWKVGFSSGYDFKGKGITFTNLHFERDLDSWRMSFNWVPFGNSTTYYFFIGVKGSVLKDLKYDQRKVPDRRLF